MTIQIYGKNFNIPQDVRNYIEEKIGKICKIINPSNILNTHVNLSQNEHHRKGNVYTIEINLYLSHKTLVATEECEDIRCGIDKIEKKLKRQVIKYKEHH
jgi:ribosomal subunit interface protein